MMRVREEEPDYFYIYNQKDNGEVGQNILIVHWAFGKLVIGSEAGLITQEEFSYLSEWMKKTRPKSKYKLTKILDDKPESVVTSKRGTERKTIVVYDEEVEEVNV